MNLVTVAKCKVKVSLEIDVILDIPDEITEIEDIYDYANEEACSSQSLMEAIEKYNFSIENFVVLRNYIES